jgi:Circularly permutated YpsA SLOG family
VGRTANARSASRTPVGFSIQSRPYCRGMLRKIISGGQTGADRAGLDFANEAGLEQGGYVPRGRKAEDGRIDDRYRLVELPGRSYAARTKRNVEEGDGTVIFSLEIKLTGGSELTLSHAIQTGKTVMRISSAEIQRGKDSFFKRVWRLRRFIERNGIEVLNVAGSRESEEPGIYAFTLRMLRQYWEDRNAPDDMLEYLHSKGIV